MKKFEIKDITLNDSKVKPETLLTGEVIKGLDSRSKVPYNAELEKDEYLKFPDGDVKKVVGKSHESGGVKMSIPDQTEVVSDHLKITAKQAKDIQKKYGLKDLTKNTYASAIDKYASKIGLKKLYKEQEEVFAQLKKEMNKENVDPKTSKVNLEYLSGKIKDIEDKKVILEKQKKDFFDDIFEKQESTKTPKERGEETFKTGGVSNKNFEALCKKMGITPEQGMLMLQDGGTAEHPFAFMEDGDTKDGNDNGGGIFVSQNQMLPTGESLTDEQKQQLLGYYRRHNPQLANAIDNEKIDWKNITLNPGLVKEATQAGYLEGVPVFEQPQDRNTSYLPNAKTYGSLSQERVQGFVLKDYYEANNPGKKFEDITPDEVGTLQQEYNDALQKSKNLNYFSGVRGEKEVSDKYFGNRTSSYVRSVAQVPGTKSGTIDVDKLFLQSEADINAALKDYGLTYKDIEPYKNAAYKYVKIGEGVEATPPEAPKDEPVAVNKVADGTPVDDNVKVPFQKNKGARLFFQPNQDVLPPSSMEPVLKGDIRLERIDPVRIGIENNIQEINNQRNFVTKQLDGLPETQRAAVLANLLAGSNKAVNSAATTANITNAQNLSQSELFNIGQSGNEEMYALNNALSFEQRQLKAKANTEESLMNYYDYNRKKNARTFENQQKLNLMDSLFPDYSLDFMGATVNYDPESEFAIQDRKNLLELQQQMMGG